MSFKIIIDKNKCIGCGACTATCNNFEMVDGKAHAKQSEPKELGCNQEAADICPVSCIKVIKK